MDHPQLDRSVTAELKEALLAARAGVLRDHEAAEEELDAIEAEREIELQELAQEGQTAEVRSRLSARQISRLRQIDGALERLERHAYGFCIDCSLPISLQRLRAWPAATFCAGCASAREEAAVAAEAGASARPQDLEEEVAAAVAGEHSTGAPLPPELSALDDAEVVETIREAFELEVGEALENVRIVCRDGVVILAGEVPNETLPEIARRIVEDEVGYEVVDRMLVTEFAGGPHPPVRHTTPGGQLPSDTVEIEDDEGEVSDDILEVEEQGLTFVPPTRPVPER